MTDLKFFANVGIQAKPNLFLQMSPKIYKIIKYYRNKDHIDDFLKGLNTCIINSFKHNGWPEKDFSNKAIKNQIILEFILIGEPILEFNYLKSHIIPILIKCNQFCEKYKAATDSVPPMGYYNSIQYIYEIEGSKFILMSFMHNLASAYITHDSIDQKQKIIINFRKVVLGSPFMCWVLSKVSVPTKSFLSCSPVKLTKVAITMTKFLIDPSFKDQSSGLPVTQKQKKNARNNLEIKASYFAGYFHSKS